MSFYEEITELIISNKIKTKKELHNQKIKLCKKYKIQNVPPDSKILAHFTSDIENNEFVYSLLKKKPMRTISGVAIVAVMTSPEICPHGKCIPCPGGVESNTPQSYTGYEPAAMRGSLNKFDPYNQVKSRTEQLKTIGHPTDKIDLIIMGGTFTSRHPSYQNWFIKRCFDALNNEESLNLELAKRKNEQASQRCIGLTIETRPDWFRLQQADNSLYLGSTRVELGVQNINDDILYKMGRGHTVNDTIYATRIAKNSGFKVCYHLMPGLPGSDSKKDIESFKQVFTDDDFKPDMIKIYPVLVIQGTKLYKMWKQGYYEPLDNTQAAKIIAKIKESIPRWVRIQRIQRDIPANLISSGVSKSNLRQIVIKLMEDHGTHCNCIRCREIGHKYLEKDIDFNLLNFHISAIKYPANGGDEIFLSVEDKKFDIIAGYLRLRNLTISHRYELQNNPCMIIRELKVLGKELPIGYKTGTGIQHRGFGRELIKEAERMCFDEFDKKQLFVLSGVGVKQYYRRLGFKDKGFYLYKKLT